MAPWFAHSMGPVLIVAAHPDDEILGAGGTIARLRREGHDVHIAILGEGAISRAASPQAAAREEIAVLRQASKAAASLLGVEDVQHFDFPDNRMDTVPLLDIVKVVERVIQEIGPSEVYTHHPGDLNVDHVATHRAVMTATRPVPGSTVSAVYAFEVPSATDWSFGAFGTTFRPNTFVDIVDTLDTKLQAMACYESESRDFPHPRSPEALRATAQRWGSVAGRGAAEAFELIRLVS